MSGGGDNETEKLIREKDEEVRHGDHDVDQQHDDHEQHESEHNFDHEHLERQPSPETHSEHMADEAL